MRPIRRRAPLRSRTVGFRYRGIALSIPAATPLSRIARFAVPAFLIGVLVCVVASGLADLPYPIASDLDSSYLAFFSIAGNRGSVAGVDYVFTYGPLAHWYLPIHFDAALVCGVALRAVTALLAVVVCCSGSTVRRGLLLSVGVVYVMLLDHNAPIVVTLLMLRSEEHTSALPSLMRSSYAVFCLKKQHTT